MCHSDQAGAFSFIAQAFQKNNSALLQDLKYILPVPQSQGQQINGMKKEGFTFLFSLWGCH